MEQQGNDGRARKEVHTRQAQGGGMVLNRLDCYEGRDSLRVVHADLQTYRIPTLAKWTMADFASSLSVALLAAR